MGHLKAQAAQEVAIRSQHAAENPTHGNDARQPRRLCWIQMRAEKRQ